MSEAPLLRVERLEFSYPASAEPALRGVDLCVARGETVALVGPNGAGKSTLVMHIDGTLRGRGRIVIGGVEIGRRR